MTTRVEILTSAEDQNAALKRIKRLKAEDEPSTDAELEALVLLIKN